MAQDQPKPLLTPRLPLDHGHAASLLSLRLPSPCRLPAALREVHPASTRARDQTPLVRFRLSRFWALMILSLEERLAASQLVLPLTF